MNGSELNVQINMDLIVANNPQGLVKVYQSQEHDGGCGGNLVTENSAANLAEV